MIALRAALFPTLLALLFGCGHQETTLDRAGDAAVVTGDSVYVLTLEDQTWETTIDYEFHNRTDDRIALTNCNGAFALELERLTDDVWVSAWSPILPMCLSEPIVIEPGQHISETLRVTAGVPESDVFPQFSGENIEGTYRLNITSAYRPAAQDPYEVENGVAEEHRVSGPFSITVP